MTDIKQFKTQPLNISPFPDLLPDDLVQSVILDLGIVFRKRIFSPLTTLWTFLSQQLDADGSCRKTLTGLIAIQADCHKPHCSPGTSSYCKAKARLPEPFYCSIAKLLGKNLEQKVLKKWLWKGHITVKIVDATTASMPDTQANQKEYPQTSSQKKAVGFPIVRILSAFSLATGAALESVLSPYAGPLTGEPSLLNRLWHVFHPGDTLLGDCSFSSYFILALAMQKNIDIVSQFKKKDSGNAQA